MTLDEVFDLPERRLQILCAEGIGWKVTDLPRFYLWGIDPRQQYEGEVPMSPRSLDAMREAETTIFRDPELWAKYRAALDALCAKVGLTDPVHARARIKCVAFVFVKQVAAVALTSLPAQ